MRRLRITGPFALALLLPAVSAGHAQVPSVPPPAPPPPAAVNVPDPSPPPSVTGFVSSYEIMRTLRAAGFDPLAPPLREGTTYVARATDYRGILMRVVLDARTGAIRDANRIVPGPGYYGGPYGPEIPPPYGQGPYGRIGMVTPPPYGQPVDYDVIPDMPDGPATMPASPHPPATRTAARSGPPLPRPRPGEIAVSKPVDAAKPAVAATPAPVVATTPAPAAPKLDVKQADPTTTATITLPSTAQTTPAPAKPAKVPPPLPINN